MSIEEILREYKNEHITFDRASYETHYIINQKNKELEKQLNEARLDNDSLNIRIKNELEPRLKREERSYDAWVSCDKSAEACESFCYKVDELVEMVKNNPEYYAFDDKCGDITEKILYIIKQEIKNS